MLITANTSLELMQKLQKVIEKEMEQLKLKAEEQIPAVAKLVPYPKIHDFKIKNTTQNLSSEPSYWYKRKDIWDQLREFDKTEHLTERYNNIVATLDEIDEFQKKVDEQNVLLIENNKRIHQKVSLIMQGLGVGNTFTTTEYSNRSTKAKTVTHSAGYLCDLGRNVPVSVSGKIDTKGLRDSALRVWRQKNDTLLQKDRDEAKKKQALADLNKMAMLRVKYTPDNPESEKEDILVGVLSKNKYLRLAHFLQMNRGDWTDGYDYAETGLNGFVVENEVDAEIEKDIQFHIDNWDGDGRIFRDCEYNYNVLFGMVDDEQLMKDYNNINEVNS